jgi:hypothetical protein
MPLLHGGKRPLPAVTGKQSLKSNNDAAYAGCGSATAPQANHRAVAITEFFNILDIGVSHDGTIKRD